MAISKLLLKWYEKEGRDLPWRETSDPYKIWVSEIILQQTRIEQGMEYYHTFLHKFPDVFSLASADISEVLNTWQGLGYYSRARNMHETAGLIVNMYEGVFPAKYENILNLKGIGEYTAGAIASIAYGERVPAVDGNVKRVISRLYGLHDDPNKPSGNRKIKEIISGLLKDENPGSINQALMDLGSQICKPKAPLCNECPLHYNCLARQHGIVEKLPVKRKKNKTKNRYFYYCIINSGDYVLIKQRRKKDIWQLLYEFPLIESSQPMDDFALHSSIQNTFFNNDEIFLTKVSPLIIHVLSHQKLHTRFVHIKVDKLRQHDFSEYTIVKKKEINNYPMPRLIHRYLEHNKM